MRSGVFISFIAIWANVQCDGADFYGDCGKRKGCFGFPEGCTGTKSCDFAVSFIGISEDQFNFQMISNGHHENEYIAVGLSHDAKMKDDAVIICATEEPARVRAFWNVLYSSIELEDSLTNIDGYTANFSDGYLSCSFNYSSLADIPGKNVTFDLSTEDLHLLMARGTFQDKPTNHKRNRLASKEPFRFRDYNDYLPKDDAFYEGCDASKGCFGSPLGCIEHKNCTMAVSFEGISATQYKYEMVLSKAENGFDKAYVAIGLSQDNYMGDDFVIACSAQNTSDVPQVARYWTVQYGAPILADPKVDISNSEVKVINGALLCSFEIEAASILPIPNKTSTAPLDMNQQGYHLLLATGPVKDGLVQPHIAKQASDNPFSLAEFNPFVQVNIYSDCGQTKGCIGDVSGCIEAKNCSMVTRFQGSSETTYEIEIFGLLPEGNNYIASALSLDAEMGDDSAMACIHDSTGAVSAKMYWNGQGVSEPLADPTFGISNQTGQLINNQLYCKFTRLSETTIQIPGGSNETLFDLNKQPYFLLMATGPVSNGSISKHTKASASESAFVFSDFNPYLNEVYDGCGKVKGCFGFPQGCFESKSCSILATYAQMETGDVAFNLEATSAQPMSYVAVALSDDKEMANSNVMFCYASETEQGVGLSWNPSNERTSIILEDSVNDMYDIQASLTDGVLSCGFKRKQQTTITTPDNQTVEYDLKQPYYLLLAKGPISKSKALGFKLESHGTSFASSTDKIDFADFQVITAEESKLVKAHGSLMVVAWVLFAALGMLTARHGKVIDKQLYGKDIWFRIHQFCMTTTWLLTIIAVVIIFVERGTEPISIEAIKKNPHGLIGLLAACLAFIQPFMAFLRPHPGSESRWIFNYSHLAVGTTAMILAIAAIILAACLEMARVDEKAAKIVAIVFPVFYFGMHIVGTMIIFFGTRWNRGKFISIALSIAFFGCLSLCVSLIAIIVQGVKQ